MNHNRHIEHNGKTHSFTSVFSSCLSVLVAIFFSSSFLPLFSVFAQQNFTMYNLTNVPQQMYANPAFMPQSRINISLPVISSVYVEAGNSGFKYSDLIHHRADDDSLEFDYPNMLSQLKKNNYLTLGTNVDLLSVGFRIKKKNYFSFNATEKAFFRLRYPKDFFDFIWNANYPTAGEYLKFNFGLDFTHYREYGLNYTRTFTDKISVGGRVKYLYGMENIRTKKTDITLYTDPTPQNTFDITASSDVIINTAGFDSASNADAAKKYMFGSGNKGFGLDMGASYKIKDDITISASIVDLGYIKWQKGTQNYVSKNPGVSFTYTGQPLSRFVSDTTTVSEGIEATIDSVSDAFEIEKRYDAYSTKLPMHIYMGVQREMNEKQRVAGMVYGHFFDGKFHPGLSISDISDFGKWFTLIVTYTIYNRSYWNVGTGLRLNLAFFQWYLACDNVFGMVFPQQAKYVNMRTGINFTFGRKDKPESKPQIENDSVPAQKEIAGLPDKDKDGVTDALDECPEFAGLSSNNGCPERLYMLSAKMDTIATADINSAGKYVFNVLQADEVKFSLKSSQKPDEITAVFGKEEKKIIIGDGNYYFLPKEYTGQLFWIDVNGNPVMMAKNNAGMFVFENLSAEPGAKFKLKNTKEDAAEIMAQINGKLRKLKKGDGGFYYLGVDVPTVFLLSETGKQIAISYQNEDGFFIFKNLPSEKYYLKLMQPDDSPLPDEIKVLIERQFIKKAIRGSDNKFRFDALSSEDAQRLSIKDAKDTEVEIDETDKAVLSAIFKNLEFDSNSDKIRSSSFIGLNELAKLLQKNPEWKLKLGGHTDDTNEDAYNLELSKKRVESVKKYLSKKGISSDRIIARYFGEKYPIASNATEAGKQKNRRVEMLFIQERK